MAHAVLLMSAASMLASPTVAQRAEPAPSSPAEKLAELSPEARNTVEALCRGVRNNAFWAGADEVRLVIAEQRNKARCESLGLTYVTPTPPAKPAE